MMDYLWRCLLVTLGMMFDSFLIEPRQMRAKLTRRQRVNDFNGI